MKSDSNALRGLILILLSCVLAACSSGDTYAPVTDIANIQPVTAPVVAQKQVVVSQAAHEFAREKRFDFHHALKKDRPAIKPVQQHVAFKPVKSRLQAQAMSKTWQWPAEGKVVDGYTGLNKGIDIASAFATPIYAANSGKVVYSGNGLRGYGNLIIIKHNSEYMSAYAHNRVLLVKEGDRVSKGQKIAEMGSSGTNTVMLHFEIRRNGRSVNPVKFLT